MTDANSTNAPITNPDDQLLKDIIARERAKLEAENAVKKYNDAIKDLAKNDEQINFLLSQGYAEKVLNENPTIKNAQNPFEIQQAFIKTATMLKRIEESEQSKVEQKKVEQVKSDQPLRPEVNSVGDQASQNASDGFPRIKKEIIDFTKVPGEKIDPSVSKMADHIRRLQERNNNSTSTSSWIKTN